MNVQWVHHAHVTVAKFRGLAIQSFRRNIRGSKFCTSAWRDHSHCQLANAQCTKLKFLWFLFLQQQPICPRKTRKFAPYEKFHTIWYYQYTRPMYCMHVHVCRWRWIWLEIMIHGLYFLLRIWTQKFVSLCTSAWDSHGLNCSFVLYFPTRGVNIWLAIHMTLYIWSIFIVVCDWSCTDHVCTHCTLIHIHAALCRLLHTIIQIGDWPIRE